MGSEFIWANAAFGEKSFIVHDGLRSDASRYARERDARDPTTSLADATREENQGA